LGGGGAYGIGFHLGIIEALEAEGVPVSAGPMIGLSAGAWAAACRVTGVSLEEVADSWRWGAARRTSEGLFRVGDVTEKLYGDAFDGRVNAVALTLPAARRVILNGADHPLAALVAASSAPPRRATPTFVGGRRLYDAGVLFNSSADRAGPADVLLVLAPLAKGALGWQGNAIWERRLQTEVAAWRVRHRGRVVVVRPTDAVVRAGGLTWASVLDVESAVPTYLAAREQGARIAEGLAARLGVARV
jgi:predicted acylesterase/phospholipase RssA